MAIQKNNIIKHLFFIMLALSVNVSAVEFGEIQVNSYLHQPLKAELSIRDLLKNEEIQIADREAYLEIGIEHFPLYETLKLKNVDNKLILTSPKKVSQPFLQLLLVVKKEGGEQFRLFTLLLDPADYVYDSKKETKAKEPVTDKPKAVEEEPQDQSVQYTIKANDTLSEIILKTIPTTELSLDERMNTVLQENPDAFINNDINRIKIGYTLKIPTVQSMRGGKPAEKTEGKKDTKQEEADEFIESDDEKIISSNGGRVQLSADEPSPDGDEESVDEDTSSLALENDDTTVAASQSSGLLQIENQNLRQKMTNLEDKVRQLEQELQEKSQKLAQEEEKQVALQEAAVSTETNSIQASNDDEIQLQEEEDNSLLWIVGIIALFTLVVIYIVYRLVAGNKQKESDRYDGFSNSYSSESVTEGYQRDELSELSESRHVVVQDEDLQEESDFYEQDDEQEIDELENAPDDVVTQNSNVLDNEFAVEEAEHSEENSENENLIDGSDENETTSLGFELEDVSEKAEDEPSEVDTDSSEVDADSSEVDADSSEIDADSSEVDTDSSEVENLLNAAKRDIMIGNRVKALSTLNDVLSKGNEEQKKRAEELMNHIGK